MKGYAKKDLRQVMARGLIREVNDKWMEGFMYNIDIHITIQIELHRIIEGLKLALENGRSLSL